MSSILFGDIMVPIIEWDYILLLGYSILYKETNGHIVAIFPPIMENEMENEMETGIIQGVV